MAEILARGAEFLHIAVHQQRKTGVGAAEPIGKGRIHRKARKAAEQGAKTVDPVCVPRDAGDHIHVARLHRPRRTAQRDHPACPACGHGIEPARGKPKMLGQPDRRVGGKREARNRKSVQLSRRDPRFAQHLAQDAGDPPVRGLGAVARVGNRGGCREHHTVIALTPHAAVRFFSLRRSCVAGSASRSAASVFSTPRWSFCVAVSGSALTKAMKPGAL